MRSVTHRYDGSRCMYKCLIARAYIQVKWDDVVPQLEKDPRFLRSVLPHNQQLHLFHAHVGQLRAKHLGNLHALFASHAPALHTRFTDLPVASLVSAQPAAKLGYDVRALEDEYERWNRERVSTARREFDDMLAENAFVEFWGRLGKIGGQGVDKTIKVDDLEDEEEEVVDMKALAKTVDLKEMVKVLKVRLFLATCGRAGADGLVWYPER